ncbi:MAG: hypothetical protein A2Z34_01170, partial [Planctomycetes bacterium RBG_16_59_8]
STLQLGEAAVIAARTGIATVANFRSADIAAGGEGGPLVPMFDYVLFGGGRPIALLNIGGIANISIVSRRIEETIAFDTGPGNTLLDATARMVTRGRMIYDNGGAMAAGGTCDERLLRRLLAHPFFGRRPPKSTDIAEFGQAFLDRCGGKRATRNPRDLLATLSRLTARSIAEDIRRFVPRRLRPTECIVSGGGVYNRTLMRDLREELAPIPVAPSWDHAIHPLAKEPAAFALLACRTLWDLPGNIPSATGARRSVILGVVAPRPSRR